MRRWLTSKAVRAASPSTRSSHSGAHPRQHPSSPDASSTSWTSSPASAETQGLGISTLASTSHSSSTASASGSGVRALSTDEICGGGLVGILPLPSQHPGDDSPAQIRRRSSEGSAVGLAKSAVAAAARGLVCSGRLPRSDSPPTILDSSPGSLTTWAEQRREDSPDAGDLHGCLPNGSAVLKNLRPKAIFPWRRSASASRQVADRLRQRRRGSQGQRSIPSSPVAPVETPTGASPASAGASPLRPPALGAALRSYSAPPLTVSVDDPEVSACRARYLPEAPRLCSPLPSDVPTPTVLASLGCPTSPLQLSFESPASACDVQVTADDAADTEQAFTLWRCCSAPPSLRLPVPAAAEVPSPKRFSPSPDRRREANRSASSAIPPLPAIPWAAPLESSPQANQTTPHSAKDGVLCGFTGSPSNAGSPTLQDLLRREGLWPPSPSSTGPAGGATPNNGNDPRLREAQRLLAQMLAGDASGIEDIGRSKRRRSSAPPLGSHTRTLAATNRCSLTPPPSSLLERSPVSISGSSSTTTSIQGKAAVRSLKPINGSMPLFPPSELLVKPGTLRGGPRH